MFTIIIFIFVENEHIEQWQTKIKKKKNKQHTKYILCVFFLSLLSHSDDDERVAVVNDYSTAIATLKGDIIYCIRVYF